MQNANVAQLVTIKVAQLVTIKNGHFFQILAFENVLKYLFL